MGLTGLPAALTPRHRRDVIQRACTLLTLCQFSEFSGCASLSDAVVGSDAEAV